MTIKAPNLVTQIFIGMFLGTAWGIVSSMMGWSGFTSDWVKPFGTIFINLLKLIAIPLVLASLISGVSNLKDIKRLSRLGGRTIFIFIITTVIAVIIGLLLVNIVKPGHSFSPEKRAELQQMYANNTSEKMNTAELVKNRGPLQFVVEIVPENLFDAMSSNTRMLQVIFFAIFFGICLVALPEDKTKPIKDFVDSLNEVILKMVHMIMLFAPIGVFALLAAVIADIAGDNPSQVFDILQALGVYSLTVIAGLAIMMFVVYPIMLRTFTDIPFKKFYKAILPAQTIGFSTSSSAAALPVNIECCEKELGISEEVTSFVLPLGATINMDGTSLYQTIAAVFIAQAFGYELTLGMQLTLIITAVLASIGTAPVPGAGMVMLIIILQSTGINPEGLALIFATDRILDMCRTVVNLTSDATVASIIAAGEKRVVTP